MEELVQVAAAQHCVTVSSCGQSLGSFKALAQSGLTGFEGEGTGVEVICSNCSLVAGVLDTEQPLQAPVGVPELIDAEVPHGLREQDGGAYRDHASLLAI